MQKPTNRENDQHGTALRDGPGSSNTLEILMYVYSGLTDYSDRNGRYIINSLKHVEFVERYLGPYNRYPAQDDLVKGWMQLTASLRVGKAGIILHDFGSGTSVATAFCRDQSRHQAAEFLRTANGNTQTRSITTRSVSMNPKPDVKEAAFQVMTAYCSTAVQIPRCKAQGEVFAVIDAASGPGHLDDNHLCPRLTE